jgi:hypothetical protein
VLFVLQNVFENGSFNRNTTYRNFNFDWVWDKTRNQQEVLQFLQAKYPDRLISQAIVSKIESKFRRNGHVKAMSKTGRLKINEDTKIDILVNMEQNPHGGWLKKLKWKVLKTPCISD